MMISKPACWCTFKNFGEPQSLRLQLSKTEHGWCVSNVIYQANDFRSIVSC